MVLKKIHNEIEAEYSKRQMMAKQNAEQRKSFIYETLPEISEIDKNLNSLCILRAYSIINCAVPAVVIKNVPKEYLKFGVAEIDCEIENLKKRRSLVLKNAGYEEDYVENVFLCSKCCDKGFVKVGEEDVVCSCRKELLASKLKQAAGVPEEDTFEKFDSSFYSDVPDMAKYGMAVSPRAQMEAVYKRCLKFVNEFDSSDTKSMVFVGGAGLGKSFLGNCIINALTDKGVSCLYMPATALFKPFAPGYYNPEEAAEIIDFINNCDFLVIDDLGSEKQTATRYSELLEILNTRELRGKNGSCKTVITTNLSPKKILDYYGERVTSRILGEYDILPFVGDDIRLKKKSM